MTNTAAFSSTAAPSLVELARCISCGGRLTAELQCSLCGRAYPNHGGFFEALDSLAGRNRIVAAFYDGPGWFKFRKWEQGFLMVQGGARRARTEILRHVMHLKQSSPLALEVGIGGGDNLAFVPPSWHVYGVDIARAQLAECLRSHPATSGRLALAEAENLPFADGVFDVVWSIGGFNYYSDHARAMSEMRRVAKPGAPIVVADEVPGLHRAGLGHLLRVPAFDAWWLNRLGLDREFVAMVLGFDVDLDGVVRQTWPAAQRYRIWHRMGYCFVDAPSS
jgi:SAM-dependent methyltransferase